jgi:hypothetical protein
MLLFVDPKGGLIDHRFVRCSETPRYLNRVLGWLVGIRGKRLWGKGALEDVHAVTGATITSSAVIELLRSSGRLFARQVLHQGDIEASGGSLTIAKWDAQGLYLICAICVAFVAALIDRQAIRLVLMAACLLVGGIWLNSQYSSEHVLGLLWARLPAVGLSGAILLFAMPIVVAILGNIHCGYICPFGGFQELVSYILPSRWRPSVSRQAMQKARFIKYLVLFWFVVGSCITGRKSVYGRDILLRVFDWRTIGQALNHGGHILWVIAILAVGIVLFRRFWCRYLCPAGAFLSLFNHIAVLGRSILPTKRFAFCEFGLTWHDHTDCIWCDRCHWQSRPFCKANPSKFWSAVLILMAVLVAVWLLAGLTDKPTEARPAQQAISVRPELPNQPQGRPVDVERIQAMISQGRLSDKEAMFYRPIGSE